MGRQRDRLGEDAEHLIDRRATRLHMIQELAGRPGSLTITVQLRPTITQAMALRETLERANAACDDLSTQAID